MGKFIDETGNRYGKLVVLKHIGRDKGHNATWLCKCDCGKECVRTGCSLRRKTSYSCGCTRYAKGPASPAWRGGISKDRNGYIRIYAPDHPNADKSGYVLEHVLIMSKIIGRPLTKEETVHHKNGIRADNSPSNLELWTGRHSKGQRVSDLIIWAKELLTMYEPILDKL